MSEDQEAADFLARITPPAVPPPDTPDERTREEQIELERVRRLSAQPAFRSVYVSEREVRTLKADREKIEDECRDLRKEITHLVPNYARLRQAFHDLRGNLGFSALALVVGGTLVSIAGAISDPGWKPICLWIGVASFGWGALLAGWTLFFVRDKEL